ncbi:BREX-2 system phosphatase PglZ [Rathayibacter sp. AY1F6]|uniref:BREX-2 system phosphatase PglZ n=1 Tax=Rathayibacter sp. AY1F6 TaxID=2080560 RepID=UPI000CE7AB23|nr:BREX-2 system phosphatase PglZ [Rathayibacter sp. AY1F6]PPH05310.1 BREX-2 system phosphatase PglZ [Rathayibacter sp. AY1F6]
MPAPTVTEPALRQHLTAWLSSERRRARTILVRAQPTWSGAETLTFGDATVRVVEGVSGLAALDAMRSAGEDEFIAVLTSLSEVELGTAVVLDAERQKVTDLDEWNIVPALFGAREYPAQPVRALGSWVPRLLVSLRRERGFMPAPGGVLSAQHVVQSMLVAMLGVDRVDALAASTALATLDDPGVKSRLVNLDQESRAGLIRATAIHVEQHLAMALRAASAPGGVSSVAVGLVVGELWASGPVASDTAVAAARVRVERYVGTAPSASAAQRYGASAKLIAQRWLADGNEHARSVLDQAEALCGDVGWAEGAAASGFLPAGLRARVSVFAEAVEAAAAVPSARASLAVDDALSRIESHGARSSFERSRSTALMAARLVRWLSGSRASSVGLSSAILAYAADGSWAERALGDLWDGDTDRSLAGAYRALAYAVQTQRRLADATAARALTGDLSTDDSVLPVESMLSRLVVPLSTHGPVLLIVLDGMSVPSAVELATDLPSRGWTEVVRKTSLRRGAALAALPTVTEYSRTSLFSGALRKGTQQLEKAQFATAVDGVVFHKDDLRSEPGHALPPAVSDAIADSGRKIVGIVLNTIDDALASADVDSLRWSLRSIAHLEAVLDAALEARRTVILTSDHGHIVERGSELRSVPQSPARWREVTTGTALADEVLVSGPRVLAPGGSAVLAVSDGLRYASKKAGYHGGAALAELTIPILVAKPRGAGDPAGWVEAPPQEPLWWNETLRAPTAPPPASPKRRATKTKEPAATVGSTLFEIEPTAEEAPISRRSTAEQLVASDIYRARRKMAGRHPIEDSVASAIVAALQAGGGRAHRDTLAVRAAVPGAKMPGLLAAFRRVLNRDGYLVIDTDSDGVTVVLDLALLKEQFELGTGS